MRIRFSGSKRPKERDARVRDKLFKRGALRLTSSEIALCSPPRRGTRAIIIIIVIILYVITRRRQPTHPLPCVPSALCFRQLFIDVGPPAAESLSRAGSSLVYNIPIYIIYGGTRSSCHRNSINHRKREADECNAPRRSIVIHVNRKTTPPTRAPEQKGRPARYVIAARGWAQVVSVARVHDAMTGVRCCRFLPDGGFFLPFGGVHINTMTFAAPVVIPHEKQSSIQRVTYGGSRTPGPVPAKILL